MKAITYQRYGSPIDVLELTEVEKPIPKERQVLLKVRAAAVNPADCAAVIGGVRLAIGLVKPKKDRLGLDVAGQVEAIGPKVTKLKPGDEVFGACIKNIDAVSQTVWFYDYGSFAEYAITHEDALVLKPENFTFEQSAAVPSVGWTALQGLRKFGKIHSGQKVLISSATGGIGTIAVQIAKAFDTEVTGVCSTKNMELVKSIGADHVIDYTKDDYTKQGQQYDLIIDSVGEHSFSELMRILTDKGKVVLVSRRTKSLDVSGWLSRVLAGTIKSKFVGNKIIVDYSRPDNSDLLFLRELMESGKIIPVIDKNYSGLTEIPQAVQYVAEGHAKGKVVITI